MMGRLPVIHPVPRATIPQLVDIGRTSSLGSIPASGTLTIPMQLPNWPRGTV